MTRFLATSAFLLGLSGIASAADSVAVESTPEPVAPIFSWTGGYAGLQAGYAWGEGSMRQDAVPEASADGDVDGWLGGVYAGYNHQFTNNFVLGVDADIAWTNAIGLGQVLISGVPLPGPSSSLAAQYELNWSGAARLKAGYAMDRFLPYIAGGLAFGGAEVTSVLSGVAGPKFSDTMVGWTLGAGIEYAFTDNFVGRAEYRYTDFGDFEPQPGVFLAMKTSDIRLGVAYKF